VRRSDWVVARRKLISEHVAGPVQYAIARPLQSVGAPTPGVICLPGRGDVAATIVDSYRIQDIVQATVGPRFAIVAVDGGSSYWHARVNGEDRLTMLLNELLPRLREENLGTHGAGVGLWGWSMGGYGALRAMVEAPDTFDVAATGGAALWTGSANTAPGAFDDADDYDRNDIFTRVDRLKAPLFIACGASDVFVDANRSLVKRLPTPARTDFSAGCHNNDYWRRIAVEQAKFLADHLSGPDGDSA
jgi:pimeloyl-ACP methyl ester carboxylesterase